MRSSSSFADDPPYAGALAGGRNPLYVALAQTLAADIHGGRYPIGSTLPTEGELAQRYSVSRHTVRQALRELKQEGLLWSRPGIGTKVRARPESPRFFSGINNISDLLQFVDVTEMHVRSRREIIADAEFADLLHCPLGQAWSETNMLRKIPGNDTPLCYLQAYLRPEYARAIGRSRVIKRPIYSLVEERCGVRMVEVLQEITAAHLTHEMAHALKAEEGQAALRISRYYLDKQGSIVEVGISHYPSGRYTQSTRFRAHSA
jgi:DNA-binding GntR family transcriptional regulator